MCFDLFFSDTREGEKKVNETDDVIDSSAMIGESYRTEVDAREYCQLSGKFFLFFF